MIIKFTLKPGFYLTVDKIKDALLRGGAHAQSDNPNYHSAMDDRNAILQFLASGMIEIMIDPVTRLEIGSKVRYNQQPWTVIECDYERDVYKIFNGNAVCDKPLAKLVLIVED